MQRYLGVQPCSKEAFLRDHLPEQLPSMDPGARQRLMLGLLHDVHHGRLDVSLLANVRR